MARVLELYFHNDVTEEVTNVHSEQRQYRNDNNCNQYDQQTILKESLTILI